MFMTVVVCILRKLRNTDEIYSFRPLYKDRFRREFKLIFYRYHQSYDVLIKLRYFVTDNVINNNITVEINLYAFSYISILRELEVPITLLEYMVFNLIMRQLPI